MLNRALDGMRIEAHSNNSLQLRRNDVSKDRDGRDAGTRHLEECNEKGGGVLRVRGRPGHAQEKRV